MRLVLNDELRQALDFMHASEYPTLTYAEMTKVAIGKEAMRIKKSKKILDYDDSDPSPDEIMYQASKSFDIDNDDEPIFWDETAIKPLNLKKHV
ncbi:hypothetical protein HZB69_03725 [Candidatus Amesbacteria bacterium]|nr:hypothetical protein [Candidatus Amesbacteria bacterium]